MDSRSLETSALCSRFRQIWVLPFQVLFWWGPSRPSKRGGMLLITTLGLWRAPPPRPQCPGLEPTMKAGWEHNYSGYHFSIDSDWILRGLILLVTDQSSQILQLKILYDWISVMLPFLFYLIKNVKFQAMISVSRIIWRLIWLVDSCPLYMLTLSIFFF